MSEQHTDPDTRLLSGEFWRQDLPPEFMRRLRGVMIAFWAGTAAPAVYFVYLLVV